MADQTIGGLTATGTPVGTDVFPTAHISGADTKTSFDQISTYVGNKNSTKTFTTKTTSSSLTASQLINTIILLNPPDGSQAYTFNSAALIYAAMGSAPVDTSRDAKLINLTAFNAGLSKTDPDLSVSGMPSLTIGPFQTVDLKLTVTQVTPSVQVTISGGQALGTQNNIENLIVVSNSGSDTSGIGTLDRPYATAAYVETQAVVGQSTILYTPGTYSGNVAFKPNIGRVGFGPQLSVLTGNITIDGTAWDATSNPHLDFDGLGFTGTVNLVGGSGALYGTDALIIKNCKLPTGTTIDLIGSIQILNNTQIANLAISTPGIALIQSELITGSLTFNEGFSGAAIPLIKLDSLGIDRLNGNLFGFSMGLPPFEVTNCSNLGTGTLDFDDQSETGNPWDITVDAISYPGTIVSHPGTVFTVELFQNIVTSSADNVFTGTNTFEKITSSFNNVSGPSNVSSYSLFSTLPVGPLTSASLTLTASQTVFGIAMLNGSGASQDVFFPTAANLETQLLSSFPVGYTIPTNSSFFLLVSNNSSTATVTLGGNTNMDVSNLSSNLILPNSSKLVIITKTVSTPAYGVFG